ncbi:MAG TPA: N-acetylmuramoyl-L-alanine amidase, partial [Pseudolabrys sp.]
VRWDYAFFQMLIETNYLTFRRPNGIPASVVPGDNNFAGVGAAISGRPGERFKDAATGVLAHLQHVLMYSATQIPEPVARRTRQVQHDVQDIMRRLHRPVTFSDLARQWTGTDKNTYAQEMQRMAEKFAGRYCAQAALDGHLANTAAARMH